MNALHNEFTYTKPKHVFIPLAQGIILVYEITSKASYDLIVSLRQKVALKNKDVSLSSYSFGISSSIHNTTLFYL